MFVCRPLYDPPWCRRPWGRAAALLVPRAARVARRRRHIWEGAYLSCSPGATSCEVVYLGTTVRAYLALRGQKIGATSHFLGSKGPNFLGLGHGWIYRSQMAHLCPLALRVPRCGPGGVRAMRGETTAREAVAPVVWRRDVISTRSIRQAKLATSQYLLYDDRTVLVERRRSLPYPRCTHGTRRLAMTQEEYNGWSKNKPTLDIIV